MMTIKMQNLALAVMVLAATSVFGMGWKGADLTKGRAPETLEQLRKVAASRQFYWAWTSSWVPNCHWWDLPKDVAWPQFDIELAKRTSMAPRMMYYDLNIVTGTRNVPEFYAKTRQATGDSIRIHYRACRGIPVFSWHMDHPCLTNNFPSAAYRFKCNTHKNILRDIIDNVKYPCAADNHRKSNFRKPYESPRAWYFAQLKEIADFFKGLVDDEGRRIPVILRYEHECDGKWFFWGESWCTPADYVAFSRMTADYLRRECGRDNILFAYNPDRTWKELGKEGDNAHNFLTWYPGDEYTDLIGYDDYSIGKGKTKEETERNFANSLSRLRMLTKFAKERGKVLAISETGCKDANLDFWERLRKLAIADGVECAYVNTWGGAWSNPDSEEGWKELKKFATNPAVLMATDYDLQRAANVNAK